MLLGISEQNEGSGAARCRHDRENARRYMRPDMPVLVGISERDWETHPPIACDAA
jgi:hypothetical protein